MKTMVLILQSSMKTRQCVDLDLILPREGHINDNIHLMV